MAELVAQLHSDDPGVRSDALEELRSDSAALRDPMVKSALVSLLDRENRVKLSGDDEGYAEYLSWLAQTAAMVVDWNNPRQVCILANGLVLPHELADHAKVSVPCLLQRYKGAPALIKGKVVAMLVQALGKGRNELNADTQQTIQQIVISGLHDPDPDEDVKIDTVVALGRFGSTNMIPALREVADDPKEHDAIRTWAVEAIEQIQKRTQVPK